MTRLRILHMSGRRLAAERQPYEPPELPAFFYDKRRPCAPTNGISKLWTSNETADLNIAAKLCVRGCPFIKDCAAWALRHDERHHVWGGRVFSRATDRRLAERGVAA